MTKDNGKEPTQYETTKEFNLKLLSILGTAFKDTDFSLKRDNKKGYIYFIKEYNFDFVKIGFSSCPEIRLKEIQRMNPHTLVLLGKIKGSIKMEKNLHKKFKKYKVFGHKGEWFYYMGILKTYIENILKENAICLNQ